MLIFLCPCGFCGFACSYCLKALEPNYFGSAHTTLGQKTWEIGFSWESFECCQFSFHFFVDITPALHTALATKRRSISLIGRHSLSYYNNKRGVGEIRGNKRGFFVQSTSIFSLCFSLYGLFSLSFYLTPFFLSLSCSFPSSPSCLYAGNHPFSQLPYLPSEFRSGGRVERCQCGRVEVSVTCKHRATLALPLSSRLYVSAVSSSHCKDHDDSPQKNVVNI